MSFPAYFNYLNEAGKITARSTIDTVTIMLTFIEEQEKVNEQNKQDFKEIEKILTKLAEKKVEEYKTDAPVVDETVDTEEFEKAPESINPTFSCPTCGKEVKSELGLKGHMRSHKEKPE